MSIMLSPLGSVLGSRASRFSVASRAVPAFAWVSAALLVLVTAPHAARAQSEPAKVYDLKAEALLQKAADRLEKVQSFSGQVQSITVTPATENKPAREIRSFSTFRLQKPNLVFHEFATQKKGTDGKWTDTPVFKAVSDGKKGAWLSAADKTYQTLGTGGSDMENYALNFPEFFTSKISDAQQAREDKASGSLFSLRMAPDETFGGVACSVVEEKTLQGKTKNNTAVYRTTKIYVGKKDDVTRGYHIETPVAGGGGSVQTSDQIVTNVEIGKKIPASVFAVDLTGYKEYVEPEGTKLLAAGTTAPDFTAYDKDGKAVKLSELQGKIVVLDFWATWCGPCMASLPHTTQVAKETADKGVVVLAVNVWDTKPAFDEWLPAHPEYAALRFVIDTTPGEGQDVAKRLYKVRGIPTQYVIDRSGKIVTSFFGYDKPNDDLKNAIAKADTKNDTKANAAP